MAVDHRAITAARNNADWYQAVFEAQGLGFKRLPFAFVGLENPAPYYSNVTVLEPDHCSDIVTELQHLAQSIGSGLGVKDSFCEMDLTKHGFETLFEASWIWRAPMASVAPSDWHPVETPAQLALWEAAWNATGSPAERRIFPDAFLGRTDTVFLGQERDGRYISGCIANMSDGSIGLSNVFSQVPSATLFSDAADAVGALSEECPVVGYESGRDLDFAVAAGFETVGTLRILVAKNARF